MTDDPDIDPWLSDEEWETLKRCEDIRNFVDSVLVRRMAKAEAVGWTQGVIDACRQHGPKGPENDGARLMWVVRVDHTEAPIYGGDDD